MAAQPEGEQEEKLDRSAQRGEKPQVASTVISAAQEEFSADLEVLSVADWHRT